MKREKRRNCVIKINGSKCGGQQCVDSVREGKRGNEGEGEMRGRERVPGIGTSDKNGAGARVSGGEQRRVK